MPGGQYDLNGKKISGTYHRVVQYESGSGEFLDGRGDSVPVMTGTTSAFATTGSNTFSGNQIIDGSLNVTGNINISGSEVRQPKTITNNYTVLSDDEIILANTISAFSASLFDATGQTGNSLIFKVIGNGNFTIQPQAGQTIDEQSNLVIADKFVSVEVIASGSNWYII